MEKHRDIYDPADKNYRNRVAISIIWTSVSKDMEFSGMYLIK